MLNFILLGIGFMLLIEGIIYLLFTKKIKNMFKVIQSIEVEKIQLIALIVIIIGCCLIFFTYKNYNLN